LGDEVLVTNIPSQKENMLYFEEKFTFSLLIALKRMSLFLFSFNTYHRQSHGE